MKGGAEKRKAAGKRFHARHAATCAWILILALGPAALSPACAADGAAPPAPGPEEYRHRYVVNDFTPYPVPDIPRPAKGVPFRDPVFGTSITRITDAPSDVPGRHFAYAQAGYPKHDIENADGTKLIIQSFSGSGWSIWNAKPPFNKLHDLPPKLVGWGSPLDVRWSMEEPDILYYTHLSKFWRYDVGRKEAVPVYDFSKDYPARPGEKHPACAPSLEEEGTQSDDNRHWPFTVKCYDPERKERNLDPWYQAAQLLFDLRQRRIAASLPAGSPAFRHANALMVSPRGTYLIIGAPPCFVYDRNWKFLYRAETHGHYDLALDDEGREVIVTAGRYYGPAGTKDMGDWVKMIDLETGKTQWLAPLDNALFHVSGNCTGKPGWAVVSTYSPPDFRQSAGWSDDSVMVYELTRRVPKPDRAHHARVWRIAHTHMVRKSYGDDPFAKINRKGTKIWFGSGWGASYKDGQYDVYQIDLPPTWDREVRKTDGPGTRSTQESRHR
ncbi:MAG: hypothetical protein GYA56_13725 [Geobacteraceae bacterium]|nr:hypothetical protein [Geobacteraceae bacterium]